MGMIDIWFDQDINDVITTARWATKESQETDEIFISLRGSFGEWTHMDNYNDMLDHLLNDWVLSSTNSHYRLSFGNMTWIYVDLITFENIRDTVIELVRKRELDQVTAKFAELTAKGE